MLWLLEIESDLSFYVNFCNCITVEMPLSSTVLRSALCKEERWTDKMCLKPCTVHWSIFNMVCLFGLPFCITSINFPAVAACWLTASISLHHTAISSVSCVFFCAAHTPPFLAFFSIPVCYTSSPSQTPSHFPPVTLFFSVISILFCSKCIKSHCHLGIHRFLQSLMVS